MNQQEKKRKARVLILGGGFGGLYAAQALRSAPVQVTLVDRRNFHLFQPLLYQVATGGLSPGDIASPLRAVLKRSRNTKVLSAEVEDIDPKAQKVYLSDEVLDYDYLVVATGASHHYFGHPEWEYLAPALKTVEDALEIRRRIFLAFETAERESDPRKRRAWLNFVVVGGGPTGVELAGALAELAYGTLKGEFRNIDTKDVKIYLLEGTDRVLPPYPPKLSAKAMAKLRRLGVEVRTESFLTQIEEGCVTVKGGEGQEKIPAHTVLWAAGVAASPLGKKIAERAKIHTDRIGRLPVEPDLSLPGYPNLFVIGDLALFTHQGGEALPGVAPVAMQQGHYIANVIEDRIRLRDSKPFRYFNKGNLAVIGRNAAVADIGFLKIDGFFAWLIWAFVHIRYLIEFDNKVLVLMQWAWNYFTRNRGARLITGEHLLPMLEETTSKKKNKAQR